MQAEDSGASPGTGRVQSARNRDRCVGSVQGSGVVPALSLSTGEDSEDRELSASQQLQPT